MSQPDFRQLFGEGELTRINRIGERAEKLSEATVAVKEHKDKIQVKVEKKPEPKTHKPVKPPKNDGPKPKGRPKKPVPVCVNCAGKSLMLPPPCIEKPTLVEFDADEPTPKPEPEPEPKPEPVPEPTIPEPPKVTELPPSTTQAKQESPGQKPQESVARIQVKQDSPSPRQPTAMPQRAMSLAQQFVMDRGGTYGQFLKKW